MIWLRTDPDGKLLLFEAITPQREAPVAAPAAAFDWGALFRAAGLDMARFQPAEPQWTPLAQLGRARGVDRNRCRNRLKLRVEAAAWRGRPVFFRILGPWSYAGAHGDGRGQPAASGRS